MLKKKKKRSLLDELCIFLDVWSSMCGYDAFQVCGDLQSTDGHQGGPTGHHHLGHSDWTEEERFPLRELCTLAHIQVSSLFFSSSFFLSLVVKSPKLQSCFHMCCSCSDWIDCNWSILFSQVESWWEILCQDDHRHAEYLWDSSKLIYHKKNQTLIFMLSVQVTLKLCFCSFQSMGLLDKKSLKINGIK